ncbi:putative coiled-coil domain-containing protein 195 [Heliangelus exortis]|uniref:putative coiled-coil domain-containing protein 195 n=1 Tax=Heliangelus exortis TaxID=472823 RepID=UPI003A8D33BC
MEGNAHLLQVIHKMRSQINRLERENRALRGELQVCGQRAERDGAREDGNSDMKSPAGDGEGPAGSAASLRGGTVAGPAPAPKEQTDATMTVRRYSTSSPVPAAPSTSSHWDGSGVQGPPRTPPPAPPAAAQPIPGEGRGLGETPTNPPSYSHSSKVRLLQDHVCKCRGKVKAVSFLLPMDVSSYAEKQGSLKSPQNQSTKQLTTITEKDM